MAQPSKIFSLAVFVAALLLLPSRAAAQSGTVTDDGFVSSNSTTQLVNLNGQGIVLVVAGSSATVGSAQVGTTKAYIKFQLQSSLPPNVAAANVEKATLKLFLSTATNPSGAIDIYPVTSSWTESTLSPSSPPAIASTAFATAIAVGKANSFLVVDVTQLVKEWMNGPSNGGIANDGIALVADTSTSYVVFDSKEGVVTSHEPRLEIVLANTGAQGPAGPQGATGATGPAGAAGAAGTPGNAATVQVGSTMTVPAGTPASVLNGGTSNAAVLNFLIPQGPAGVPGLPGATGQQGPVGINNRGAWVSGGNTGTGYNPSDAVTYNNSFWMAIAADNGSQPPSSNPNWQLLAAGINNRGAWSNASSYNLNDAVFDSASYWLAIAANSNSEPSPTNTSWQLLAGGIVNRGPWSNTNNYNINDTVSDAGSYWLAVVPTSATATPPTSCEPSQATCAADWQLLAAQGTQGAQGQTGAPGQQGIQGQMGLPGPPGPMPVGAAITTQPNTFLTSQTITGNLILNGSPAGIQFGDGSVQTTAATSSGTGQIACFAATSGPNTCPVVLSSSSTPPPGYWPLNSVTSAPILNPTWTPVAPPRTLADGSFGIAGANGILYVVGGDNSPEDQTLKYDPGADKWTQSQTCTDISTTPHKLVTCPGSPLPILPSPRSNVVAVAADGPVLSNVYAFGGVDTTGRGNAIVNTEVDVYDPNSNTWSKVGDVPGIAIGNFSATRSYFAGANLNGQIYILGGEAQDQQGLTAPVPTVSVFNPATNGWSSAADMPSGREKFAAAALNGKLYAMGGLVCPAAGCTSAVPPSQTNSVDIYDLQSNTWSSGPPMPISVQNASAASAINGLIYVLGGPDGLGGQSTLVFDPLGRGRWSAGPSLPAVLGDSAGLTTIGNSLYAVGTGLADVLTLAQTTYGYVKVCTAVGQVICGTTCSDNTSDVNNCGACGQVCGTNNATPACTNSVCSLTCNPGFGNCDGKASNGCESNLSTDPFNCGSCGALCPTPGSATIATCTASVCGFTCYPGYADCDKNPANGCEVHIAADTNNCGACGAACPAAPPNAFETCTNSVCGFTCNQFFANCDGIAANGCEVNIGTDVNNCGGCGIVCAAGQVCIPGGGCFTPLPSGSPCGNNYNCISGVCSGGICQ